MPTSPFYDSETIQKAYTPKKLLDLVHLIIEQVSPVYSQKGMIFPISCSSTLLNLGRNGPASVTEIAKILGHPHQTVAQHLNILTKLGLVRKHADRNDKRRSEYRLTKKGSDQADRLNHYNLGAAEVFQSLSDDVGVDMAQILDAAYGHLKRRTIADRFSALSSVKEAS